MRHLPGADQCDPMLTGVLVRGSVRRRTSCTVCHRQLPIRFARRGAATIVLVASLVVAPAATAATSSNHDDPTVLLDWNAVATSTLAGDARRATSESFLYMGFVQAVVYNAVVGINGPYEPYRFSEHGPRHASTPAAVAAAAHRVLVTYEPYATASLDASYTASLATIPNGSAKPEGIAFGERAADTLIQQRDFAEVKAFGSVNSTARTADQTATARFFSGNNLIQFNAALRDQVTIRHLDIVDAARMFAAVTMSEADNAISVWRAKYTYGLWRPITAIQLADTDGNPATQPDPTWTPLIATPYPEYVSGYSGTTGAFTAALAEALDTPTCG